MSSGTNEEDKPVNKPGRWTVAQMEFMKENVGTMTIEDMARQLEKNPITVKKYCVEKLGMSEDAKVAIMAKFDIKKSPIWDELKMQLSEGELDTFMYHWQNLMVQFSKDIPLSTERMQMVELVRIEILINRVMRKLKDTDVIYKKSEDELFQEKSQPLDQRDQNKIIRLEMLITSLNTSRAQLSKDYKEFMTKKEDILRTLKATREARIKRIEDSRETIQTWMASIVDSEEHRRNLGLEMKKQQLALYQELSRLSEYHCYEDKSIEQPILNYQTVKEDNV